jgi:hypothetical protein
MQYRKMTSAIGSAILSIKPLPPGPMPTLDPFLFCVYHKDQYPPGNANMEAPRMGDGSDFDPKAAYRMYHGETVPGFPQHPHRGFETITATIDGIIDHADSAGNAGRYGMGDVQWMTAGKGCVHSEMFPLIEQNRDNPMRFFQIWLNLPSRNKMADPGFAMFWADSVPKYISDDEKSSVTVWAGSYFGVKSNNPPPSASWASDPRNDVAVLHMTLQPGGKLTLPVARGGPEINRSLFYIEGDSNAVKVDGREIAQQVAIHVMADRDLQLEMSESAKTPGQFLMLQGRPINEPVAQHGPFVMNSRAEIQQAFEDYQRTQFGGWPWPRDDMVFAKEKSRFAKLNGTETFPADATCSLRNN